MKFLHIADLHLDSPLRTQAARSPAMAEALKAASRQVLRRIVDAAIGEGVDALLMAGDIFDNGVGDVASRAALAFELSRLAQNRIPAVLIQGNHDALLDLGQYGPISDAVTVLTPQSPTLHVGQAAIHGIGFSAPRVSESLLGRYPQPEPGKINLGLMHTSLDGAPGHDRYAPCALADLMGHGYDYWALGHIHKRAEYVQGGRMVVMPGIPQGRSVREVDGGSATLVEIDLDGVRARPLPVELLRFTEIEADLTGAEDQATRAARIGRALAGAQHDDVLIAARLHLRGGSADLGDPAMLEALAREAVEDIDGVFVDKVRIHLTSPAAEGAEIGDLAALMQADAAGPGFRDAALADLAELRAALPSEIRDELAEADIDAADRASTGRNDAAPRRREGQRNETAHARPDPLRPLHRPGAGLRPRRWRDRRDHRLRRQRGRQEHRPCRLAGPALRDAAAAPLRLPSRAQGPDGRRYARHRRGTAGAAPHRAADRLADRPERLRGGRAPAWRRSSTGSTAPPIAPASR